MPLPAFSLFRTMYAWWLNPLLHLFSRNLHPLSLSPHRIICPTGNSLSLSQHIENPRIPCHSPHRVLRSSECCMSPSVFNVPRHPSLPNVEASSYQTPLSLPLPDSCRCHLAAANLFSIVSLSCSLGAVCLHLGWRCLPRPPYPFSFSHTSYIGRNATHSTNVFCWR